MHFKDYAFFVPTDIGGRKVTVRATAKPRALSKAQQQHFARDLGTAEAAELAGQNCELTADAVTIDKTD